MDYREKCYTYRHIADEFGQAIIDLLYKDKDKRNVNKAAWEIAGVPRTRLPEEPMVTRPMAPGAPEYIGSYPVIIGENWILEDAETAILYVMYSGEAVMYAGYGRYPVYVPIGYVNGELPVSDYNIKAYTAITHMDFHDGYLEDTKQSHNQVVFSFAILYALTFFKVSKRNKKYIVWKGETTTDVVSGEKCYATVTLDIGLTGIYVEPKTVCNQLTTVVDGRLENKRLLYTPCELYDAVQILSQEFRPAFYDIRGHDGLVLVDQNYLEKARKKGYRRIDVLMVDANNPNEALHGAELVTAYSTELKTSDITGEPILVNEISTPRELYEALVLARLD